MSVLRAGSLSIGRRNVRIFIPHISYFSILILVLIVGVLGDVGIVGQLFGAMLAMATDPVLIVGSLLIGASIVRQYWLILCAVVFSVALSAFVAYINSAMGVQFTLYMVIVRFITILGIAFIANFVRIAATSRQANTLG